MKTFNLQDALAGKPVVTRNGQAVAEMHLFDTLGHGQRLLAVINGCLLFFNEDGTYFSNSKESNSDLFMAPETKTGWTNVYKEGIEYATGMGIYSTKEMALKYATGKQVDTVQITFNI